MILRDYVKSNLCNRLLHIGKFFISFFFRRACIPEKRTIRIPGLDVLFSILKDNAQAIEPVIKDVTEELSPWNRSSDGFQTISTGLGCGTGRNRREDFTREGD